MKFLLAKRCMLLCMLAWIGCATGPSEPASDVDAGAADAGEPTDLAGHSEALLRWLPWPFPDRDLPPLPPLRIERCNGFDDDLDGRVDEGASVLCDDGMACTYDTCDGANGCLHIPNHRMCRSGAECMQRRCGEPYENTPGQDADPWPDANGCYTVYRHDFCTDEWDGCACNGAERCDPRAAAAPGDPNPWDENLGCVLATPPLELPCEQNGGDGDGCTIETCCEPWAPDSCQLHAELDRRGLGDDYQFICGVGGGNDVSTPRGDVQCPGWPVQYVSTLAPDPCEVDDDPCLVGHCDSPSGACQVTRLNGPQPGCDFVDPQGCGRMECRVGRCVPVASEPDADDPAQCHGYAAVDTGSYVIPTCLRNECQGTRCVQVPTDEPCGDGFCDGTCSLENLQKVHGPDLEFHPLAVPAPSSSGCGDPCSDGLACTQDVCNEQTDSCSHVPNDRVCHDRRNLPYNACEPAYECLCEGDDCGWEEYDGCSTVERARCDDGNSCTADSCQCADEFCQTGYSCSHLAICIDVRL